MSTLTAAQLDHIARTIFANRPTLTTTTNNDSILAAMTALNVDDATRRQLTWRIEALAANCAAAQLPNATECAAKCVGAAMLADDVAAELDWPADVIARIGANRLASICQQVLCLSPFRFNVALALLKCVAVEAADDDDDVFVAVIDFVSERYESLDLSQRSILLPLIAEIAARFALTATAQNAALMAQRIDLLVDSDTESGAKLIFPTIVNRLAHNNALKASPLRSFLVRSLACGNAALELLSAIEFLDRHAALLHLLATFESHEREATLLAGVVARATLCPALLAELAHLDPAHVASLHANTTPLFNNDIELVNATRIAVTTVRHLTVGGGDDDNDGEDEDEPSAATTATTTTDDFSGMFFVDKTGSIAASRR